MRLLPSLAATLVLAAPLAAAYVAPVAVQLHHTGLYAGEGTLLPAPGVRSFSPQYPLWSDGAQKRRWIALPPGTAIDASDASAWEFPVGTRLWKEFSVDGRRLETRMLERLADGSWRFASYAWNREGTQASLAPAGGLQLDLGGGRRYVIPAEADCRACHEGAASPVLGFSALQLSPDRDRLAPHAETPPADALDLSALVEARWLTGLPQALIDVAPAIAARTPEERAALGYLHGNCGHCHASPDEAPGAVPVALDLAFDVMRPDEHAPSVRALTTQLARYRPGAAHATTVLAAGDAKASVLVQRMRSRAPSAQMPPLGSAVADDDALALIERWVDALPDPEEENRP